MGLVRFALALIVLMTHSGYAVFTFSGIQFATIGALASVQVFFVLSGVYMAAVWQTKYNKLDNGMIYFFINRALRLWPTYICLMALTLLAYILLGHPAVGDMQLFTLFREVETRGLDGIRTIMLGLSVLLFGQDFVSFNADLHYLLPVRQSWSIATELLFYLMVPLLCRAPSVRYLLVGFLVLMGVKYLSLIHFGWRYSYFIPFGNFGHFLLGVGLYSILSNRHVEKIRSGIKSLKIPVFVGLLTIFFTFKKANFESGLAHHFAFVFIFSVAVVLLFDSSINRIDIFLGNISYGIYLNHFLMLVVGNLLGFKEVALLLFTLSSSMLLSFFMEKIIQAPIDRQRYKLTKLRARIAHTRYESSPI